jgi:hypothetical protein
MTSNEKTDKPAATVAAIDVRKVSGWPDDLDKVAAFIFGHMTKMREDAIEREDGPDQAPSAQEPGTTEDTGSDVTEGRGPEQGVAESQGPVQGGGSNDAEAEPGEEPG